LCLVTIFRGPVSNAGQYLGPADHCLDITVVNIDAMPCIRMPKLRA